MVVSRQTFSAEGQVVNISGFVSHRFVVSKQPEVKHGV